MSTLMKDKLFLILLALFGLTLLSWLGSVYLNIEPKILGCLIMVISFLKVRLIIVHYMELAKTFPILRWAFETWVLLVASVTIALYLGNF